MATFTQVGGRQITFSFEDVSQNRSTAIAYVGAAVTDADAVAFADALGTAIETASDAKIVSYSITNTYRATASAAAVAGGNVEQKAVIRMLTAAGKTVVFNVPAPKVGILTTNERELDTSNVDVTAITDLLVTGNGTVAPVDSNGQDLTELLGTKVRHRASTQG